MNFSTIQVDYPAEKIAVITMNRPEKKNAISIAMRKEISSCLKMWHGSDDVGAVIITGAGGTFSAGFDLSEFKEPDLHDEVFSTSSQYHRDLWNFPKPVIAAAGKHSLAGGLDLLTLCDIRICTENSVFGHPEVKFGAPPLFTPLKWIIGNGMARDLCLTGRFINAADALRMGLVSEIVSADRLLARAVEIAKVILEAPAVTLAVTKKFMASGSDHGFEESFYNEHDAHFNSLILKR